MRIEYDQAKREATIRERGLDFEDASKVLQNALVAEDKRKAYPERRFNALGELEGVLLNVTFCVREAALRIISMRKASRKEREVYEKARE